MIRVLAIVFIFAFLVLPIFAQMSGIALVLTIVTGWLIVGIVWFIADRRKRRNQPIIAPELGE